MPLDQAPETSRSGRLSRRCKSIKSISEQVPKKNLKTNPQPKDTKIPDIDIQQIKKETNKENNVSTKRNNISKKLIKKGDNNELKIDMVTHIKQERLEEKNLQKTILPAYIKKESVEETTFKDIEKKIFEPKYTSSKKAKKPTKRTPKKAKKPTKRTPKKPKKPTKRTAKKSVPSSSKKKAAVPKKVTSELEATSRHKKNKKNEDASQKDQAVATCSKSDLKTVSDSDDSEMEELDELDEILNECSGDGQKGVQIELESTNVMWGMTNRKKRSHKEMVQDYIRKKVNRSIKEAQEDMHKTHLLCLIAHGRHVNTTLNSEIVMAAVLTTVPKKAYPGKRLDMKHLKCLLGWFCKNFNFNSGVQEKPAELELDIILKTQLEKKEALSEKQAVLLFAVICRTLGITTRLVMNLVPLSWKPSYSNLLKAPKKEEPPKLMPLAKPKVKQMNSRKVISSESEDDDAAPKTNKKQKPNDESVQKKSKTGKKTSGKTKASGKVINKSYLGCWVEVFCEEEERWLSVEVTNNKIHFCPELQSKLAPNSAYILAFNPDLTIKDVTKRYISSYLSSRDKLRLDNDWWTDSLSPFRGVMSKRDKAEEAELEKFLHRQPLPKTISEYKNHPLYALQRHLLKFEAIYPPDATPVGFFRGESVFPRDSVKTLAGRERWIRDAKTIKVGEEPYKIVKARPKYDKSSCTVIKDIPLEVFGDWQIEDYKPPEAANGKVPRNEYGNVELFQLSMLPKGCAYLQVPGLNKVARRLGIDCAAALTGFDFHGGYNHAVHDGFVVCQEFEDVLLIAWQEEQEAAAIRQEANRVRTIYGNWKKLIKGLLIREKVWQRYGHEVEAEKEKAKQKPAKKTIKQADISAAQPTQNERPVHFKIDMDAPVVGSKKSKKELPEESDSSDAETQEVKQEKMRNILNWNPTAHPRVEPNLSDESGDESPPPAAAATKPKNTKRPKKLVELSEHSTSESEDQVPPTIMKRTRRAPRKTSYKVQNTDAGESYDDSDADKDFQPAKKLRKK